MLVTDDAEMAKQARFLATQARDPAAHYQHSTIGYNYRLSNISAAIGRGQLLRLAGKVTRRRDHHRAYQKAFAACPGITMQPEATWGQSTHWLSCLTIDPAKAGATTDEVRLALEKLDIEARPIWKPLHLQPVFAGAECHGGKVAEGLFAQGLCLPSGSGMSVEDRDRVIAGVKSVLK
jgi:pyridoxal phosphate-dependent aminotransferase EpsN